MLWSQDMLSKKLLTEAQENCEVFSSQTIMDDNEQFFFFATVISTPSKVLPLCSL